MVKTIEWTNEGVRMINQLLLPNCEEYVIAKDYQEVADAIKRMVIRGAPAIGVAAAMGIALGLKNYIDNNLSKDDIVPFFERMCNDLLKTRPTAVNLRWAVDEMKKIFYDSLNLGHAKLKEVVIEKALFIYKQDIAINEMIGKNGATLINKKSKVMTHCNAGALATAGYGTAVGVIRKAFEDGKIDLVYVNETRPYLQGARLTAWELMKYKIPFYLITDNMAGYIMKKEKVDCIIVGADRIAANGDTANKIGTYSLAVLAHYHKIPFYIAAPSSTFDLSIKCGDDIPIEYRSEDEVKKIFDKLIAPAQIKALHPAFDVTPNKLISAIITEKGILYKPFTTSINKLIK
jgi:methylthioribose-1-phosphate isomerase